MGIFSPSVTKRVLNEEREITIIHENKYGKKLLTTGTPIFDENKKVSMVVTTSKDITRLTKNQHSISSSLMIDMENIDDTDILNDTVVTGSLAMKNVMALTKKLAMVNSTVLITGESGVGKGMIANLLHEEGNR